MSRITRNILLGCGIIGAIVLVGLRIEGQLNPLSGGLGMFSELLGYGGTKQYAVVLFDPAQEPLLFLFDVSEGSVTFTSIFPAHDMLQGLPRSDFPSVARALAERLGTSQQHAQLDAIGFTTTAAAGEFADALGGVTLDHASVTAGTIAAVVWSAALSQDAVQEFSQLAFPKINLVTHSPALLYAGKDVFAKGTAGMYFIDDSPFGKPCIGACGSQISGYLMPANSY